MPERTPRNEAFSSNDRSSRAGIKTTGSHALDGSERTASNLLQDLEKQIRANDGTPSKRPRDRATRHSSFVILSTFDIRHSSFSPCPLTLPSSKSTTWSENSETARCSITFLLMFTAAKRSLSWAAAAGEGVLCFAI